MLAGIRKRLARKQLDIKECEDDDKDDLHNFIPPTNYIKISQGKIQLVHQSALSAATAAATTITTTTNTTTLQPTQPSPPSLPTLQNVADSNKDKDVLECRIIELEAAVLRLQEKVNNSQCGSPTFEKELREQLENMSRVMKSKERKQLQTCRDHKALQTRFARQENLLHTLQQENKALLLRIRQYEHCLDDVMRKVVDALVAEDNLREEVALLKSRVRDLEAQNAALSASPAKGRDEGYCTMSSGQPQPSNSHLEDLPEEPEQWLLPAEPCSTEMEDWSMSQEELAVITLDEEREQQQQQQQQQRRRQQILQQQQESKLNNGSEHDWIWNSSDLLNSTTVETDSVSDNITQLLQQKIIYSEDEEVTCTEFTNDFYKLVNIRSNSARSMYSYLEGDTDGEDDDEDDEDDDDDDDDEDDGEGGGEALHNEPDNVDGNDSLTPSHKRLRSKVLKSRLKQASPTPSEAGRAQVTSCSSSETDDLSQCTTTTVHRELVLQTTPEHPTIDDNIVNNEHSNDTQLSDTEIEDMQKKVNEENISNTVKTPNKYPCQLSEHINEKECIEQIIRNELNRKPRHKLMKSQSTIEEVSTHKQLRIQHKQHQHGDNVLKVLRSGSVNGNLAAKAAKLHESSTLYGNNQSSSWRRCNGWKRINSPLHSPTVASPKKVTKVYELKIPPKMTPPTRIPSCVAAISSNCQQQQLPLSKTITTTTTAANLTNTQPIQQTARKSKIPPPVPIRRSYVS
ncbi:probable WRKY transcription factor protein 1 isoform X2 [Glossina fuscipes]|uniref:Probable WRKY transcription factor protein 1 isoform X2 n=1 Tax=Glossina fuscipes TaxID=7396 RepID=A0A9C5Z759_9MUSC|nr:probable WRKY transcription factor protein 1 isoform X2 [Glossina fuscipes]